MQNNNPTHYYEGTPQEVKKAIDSLLINRRRDARIRFWYGDPVTGKPWNDTFETTGFIGRSTGTQPIPLLIANRRSSGGGSIMTNRVLKMTVNGHTVYEADNFQMSVFIKQPIDDPDLLQHGLTVSVFCEDENVASFKTEKQADRWIAFMTGNRATP